MMKIYQNIEAERDRIQTCIQKFGWTSDHNLDWFVDAIIDNSGIPVFVEFPDGSGLLTHKYKKEWRIWSDPLSEKIRSSDKIYEFSKNVLREDVDAVWCDDVSENIRSELIAKNDLSVGEIYYSLKWPVLEIEKYDPGLPGGHFKEIRNAKNKFYKENKVEVVNSSECAGKDLNKIIDKWKEAVKHKPDVYDGKYRNAVENNFRGFLTSRALIVNGKPAGFNAGYEVVNKPGRFAGIVGIHDYSHKDLGIILWLEDLDWIKRAGYKEMDMQGSEDDGGLKFKMQFNPFIERRTDTFSLTVK